MLANNKGFTLIELIVGIVALSAALLVLTGILVPQAEKSTNPWFQVRSAELAQSLMNEINARAFDENSPKSGQPLRCDETGAEACIADLPACDSTTQWAKTNPNAWAEDEGREKFDDIDDFHCLFATGDEISNIENESLQQVYQAFTVTVEVRYAGTDLGLTNRLAKRITVSVAPPRGSVISYTSYRTNY